MSKAIFTVLMLCASNLFMSYGWYGVLKDFKDHNWFIAVLAGWGIAFIEYMILVPANRMGHQVLNVPQLKIMQEVWAGFCLLGAVYFMFFRGGNVQ